MIFEAKQRIPIKILFTTEYKDSPSSILNVDLLSKLNSHDNVNIDFFNNNYENYDVVLFMGYDHDIENARNRNEKLLIGVIDPRPAQKQQPIRADFILSNGIEMRDWYRRMCDHILDYYIYPVLASNPKRHENHKTLKIAYHGNLIHLQAMCPRITNAMERLADEIAVDLCAMYNIKKLGKWDKGLPVHKNLKITHVQWSPKNYYRYIKKADIGIVPNLIDIRHCIDNRDKQIAETRKLRNDDYLLRFKVTSNPGRIFVFAQFGIPVVADMFPSALQTIEDGFDGCLCYSTDSWYWALKELAFHPARRDEMGQRLKEKFDNRYSPAVQNAKLIKFVLNIQEKRWCL